MEGTRIILRPRKKARIEIIPLIDVIFFLLATFVLGALFGAGLARWEHGGRQYPHHRPIPFLPGPPGALELTAAQEVKAHEITERYRPQLEQVLHETFPKVQAINDQMERELRAILTPEQAKRLDEMKALRPPMPPGFMHPPAFPPLPPPP